MTEETIGAPHVSSASHCAAKSGGFASPASGGTAGPHRSRKSRTRVSCSALRGGAGSGTQRLRLKPPLLPARTSAAQAMISSGFINSAPHDPSPPALATAIESDGALAPAIGASRIGTCRPKRRQKAAARSRVMLIQRSLSLLHPKATRVGGQFAVFRTCLSQIRRCQRVLVRSTFRCSSHARRCDLALVLAHVVASFARTRNELGNWGQPSAMVHCAKGSTRTSFPGAHNIFSKAH